MTVNRGDFRNENKFNDMYVRARVSECPRFVHPRHDVRIAARCNYFREDSQHPLAADRKINREYRFA